MKRRYFKPMLSGRVELVSDLYDRYPLLASPKLDGIRATVQHGQLLSRSLKLIPNKYTQKLFGRAELNGLDGELIVGNPTEGKVVFRRTDSAVMSVEGNPEVTFYVFDCACVDWISGKELAFHKRMAIGTKLVKSVRRGLPNWPVSIVYRKIVQSCIQLVAQETVENVEQLLKLENEYLRLGYEGLMLRSPFGFYKEGRSTFKEGWLLKLKRFKHGEAVVIGVEELQHNNNVVSINALGSRQRSSHKAGMVAGGVLGALVVRDCKTGVVFNIGTGFSAEERERLWLLYYSAEARKTRSFGKLEGAIVRYKYFPTGSKTKPRIPVFDGFRDRRDM